MSGARRAERLLDAMAPFLQADRGYGAAAIPAFLHPLVEVHNTVIRAGAGVGCRHIDNCDPEQIHHVAVWRPGQIACNTCAAAGWLNHTGDQQADARQNWTCDRCSQFRPGKVSASVARAGRTLVWFGICTPCADQIRAERARTQEVT